MNRKWMMALAIFIFLGLAGTAAHSQDRSAPASDTVHMLVTAEVGKGANEPPVIHREDVLIRDEKQQVKASEWVPFREDSPLELFVLIDDSLDSRIGNALHDVRDFITRRPPATAVGVGYLRNGSVLVAQQLTTDHMAAAKAVRLPIGGPITSSPYDALKSLVQGWPASKNRRGIVIISNGIEPFGTGSLDNPIVNSAIEAAQKANVPVFAIYSGAMGHFGHSMWRTNLAQSYLSRLADETGGEMYNLIDSDVSFSPFMTQIAQRLGRQYMLGFVPMADKPGFHRVRITTEVPHVELVAADSVWVGP